MEINGQSEERRGGRLVEGVYADLWWHGCTSVKTFDSSSAGSSFSLGVTAWTTLDNSAGAWRREPHTIA